MQSLAWATAADAAEGDGAQVLNIVLGDRRDPDAIASLRRVSRRPTELALTAFGEPIDVLYRDRAALAALCDAIAELRLPVKLRRLLASSPTADELTRAYARRGVVVRRDTNPYPAIRLDETWLEPEGRFNSGRRSDLRRARRRAEALGTVTVDLTAPGLDQVDALLADAVAVEAAGWKSRAGTALAADHRQREFFRHWTALAAQDGSLRMAFLRLDGRPVAMQLAAEAANRLWLLKIGYDEEVARCSPGNLLMLEVVRAAAQRGLSHVEFLGRSEAWTALWTTQTRACVGIAAYPYAVGSAPVLAKDLLAFSRARRSAVAAVSRAG
nr:GNAT family N-acetyltransferase [Pseudonocardia acidicola]